MYCTRSTCEPASSALVDPFTVSASQFSASLCVCTVAASCTLGRKNASVARVIDSSGCCRISSRISRSEPRPSARNSTNSGTGRRRFATCARMCPPASRALARMRRSTSDRSGLLASSDTERTRASTSNAEASSSENSRTSNTLSAGPSCGITAFSLPAITK